MATPKKHLAILLSGLHYDSDYKSFGYFQSSGVDFRPYVKNIRAYIYNVFSKNNYNIDTFICTNDSTVMKELITVYEPKRIEISPNTATKRIDKIAKGLNMIYKYSCENKIEYNLICMLRFDMLFTEPLVNIDLEKLNIFSTLEHEKGVDDNFHLFPGKMLTQMIKLLQECDNAYALHHLYDKYGKDFEKILNINYIKNEYTGVSTLSSFKLNVLNNPTSNYTKEEIRHYVVKNLLL